MNFNKKITVLAAVMGALTVIIGAFGAHGLKEIVSEKTITSFETGVRDQMFHVILLLIIGFSAFIDQKTQKWVSRFFVFGILLFSGSIYFIALKDIFLNRLARNVHFHKSLLPLLICQTHYYQLKKR